MTQLDLMTTAAPAEPGWTQLPPDERTGRVYRWRLDPKATDVEEFVDDAHPLFEVEFFDGESWRPVRFHDRRDAIWRAVRAGGGDA